MTNEATPLVNFSNCFDIKNKLQSRELKALLDLTNIKYDDNLVSICQAVCSNENGWFCKGERYEVQTTKYDYNSEKIFKLAAKLGFTRCYDASSIDKSILYDLALVHGSRPYNRFPGLINAWKDGIRFKEIIVATTKAVPCSKLEVIRAGFEPNEMGNMQYVLQSLMRQEGVPYDLKNLPIKWIDTPTPEDSARPRTQHTILELVKKVNFSTFTNIIAVSNSPFTIYQNKIVEAVLAFSKIKDVKVHTIAEAVKENEVSAPIILDSIAKAILLEATLYLLKKGDGIAIKEFYN